MTDTSDTNIRVAKNYDCGLTYQITSLDSAPATKRKLKMNIKEELEKLTREQCVRFAIDCAERAGPELPEAKDAIQKAKQCIDNPCEETAVAAAYAAYAADAAVDAAAYVADADAGADYAAAYAADASAYAADAAVAAVAADAADAADAAYATAADKYKELEKQKAFIEKLKAENASPTSSLEDRVKALEEVVAKLKSL